MGIDDIPLVRTDDENCKFINYRFNSIRRHLFLGYAMNQTHAANRVHFQIGFPSWRVRRDEFNYIGGGFINWNHDEGKLILSGHDYDQKRFDRDAASRVFREYLDNHRIYSDYELIIWD